MRNLAVNPLLNLCVSFLLIGCSSFPSSTNELWKRSGYEMETPQKLKPVMTRKVEAVETIYVGRRVLPSGDYLQEGVVLLAITKKPQTTNDPNLKSLK